MATAHPDRRRWIILALIFCAFLLNYTDRQIVSILKPTLKVEFGLDDRGYALLVNVFTVCYAAMYPVVGWLTDRFGPGRVMLGGILLWSAACLGAGFARTFAQLAFLRGVLGAVEPTAFPAQLRVIAAWFPGSLRATANSICATGSSVGAIIAPPLIAWLALTHGWQMAFIVPGILGIGVGLLWWLLYRDPPKTPSVVGSGMAAAGHEQAFTWSHLWRTRSLWGIVFCRFLSDPVWYFCLFWLPGYLQESSGLSLSQIGMVGWIPFLFADLGGIGTSVWSDRLVRRGCSPLHARKHVLSLVALAAPVCVLTPHVPHVAITLAIFSVVGAICLSWLFTMSVIVAEAFPATNGGSVLGIAAGFGAAGAILFNTFVGEIIHTVGAAWIFGVMAFLHPAAAVVLRVMVRRERPALDVPGFG
ncbi:MAG TPA: MFS transporter [Opitutaceae bacterium]|nr:MFS transporter [Opitutaceae bacterium]